MDNNSNDSVGTQLAANMGNMIGALSLQVAQLQTENKRLMQRVQELTTKNKVLEKSKDQKKTDK